MNLLNLRFRRLSAGRDHWPLRAESSRIPSVFSPGDVGVMLSLDLLGVPFQAASVRAVIDILGP